MSEPPPPPERFVDRAELAGIMGISVSTLDRLVKTPGFPSVTWGRRTRRFRVSEVLAWQAEKALGGHYRSGRGPQVLSPGHVE